MRVKGGRKPPTTPDAPNANERRQIERVQVADRTRAAQDRHHHPVEKAPPPDGGLISRADMASRQSDLRALEQNRKRIEKMHDPAAIWSTSDPFSIPNLAGFGVPSLIDMVRHGHNSIDLQKVANPQDAMPLVAGFAFGGPHFREQPGMETIPQRAPSEAKSLAKRSRVVKRVSKALETSPLRQRVHQHFDENSPTPEAAQSQKDLWDQQVHELALKVSNRPQAVRQVIDHLAGKGPHADPQIALGDLHLLYQADPPRVPALPTRVKGGPMVQKVYKLVAQGAAYKDWYQRASWVVKLAAQKEGITYDQMAQIVAITSQGANPTFNLRLALEAVQNYKKFGRVQIGPKAPYIFDPAEVESVLKGGTWEGRKRSSFYQNITQETDHVTVDRHIAQMIFKTDSPTAKQYDKAEALFRDIAAQLGWSPKEVQAAAWVPWKAQGQAARVAKSGRTPKPVEAYMPTAGDAYEQGWRASVMQKISKGKLTANEKNRVALGYEQKKGNDLEGLPTNVKYRGEEIPVHSNALAQSLAEDYMREAGLPYDPPRTYAKVDKARAERIAKWYDEAVDAPNDPAVRAAYDAMAQETLKQYDTITRAGYTFEFYPDGVDPYPGGPREAMIDLQQNRHMYVFPTEAGFGTEHIATTHPLLEDSGLKWGEKTVTHNDVFRAVHDFFGHFKEGVGFRADGEENAWRAHSAMYSEQAKPAMTSETRGQNSWVNFGKHGEANRKASQADTVYADQKAVLAPDWVVNDGAHDAAPAELPARESTGQSFATDAATALDESAKAALDIARLLPEDQWPAWVKNQIRTQAVGRDAPIELPNPPSPLDQNLGPTQRYMEHLATKATPDKLPSSWLSKFQRVDGLSMGFGFGFEDNTEYGLIPEILRKLRGKREGKAAPTEGETISLADSQSPRGGYIKKPVTYLRFGDLPKGASMNHLTGKHEAGVSVYPAWHDPKTGKYVIASGDEQFLQTQAALQGERGNAISAVTGHTLADVGGDGEPLLQAGSVQAKNKVSLDDIVFESDPGLTMAGNELSASETPNWHPSPEEKLIEGLKGAKGVRAKQETLRHEERVRRAGAAEEAMQGADGLEASIQAAKEELKGALPRVGHNGLRALSEDEVDLLAAVAKQHPELRLFEKVRVMDAVRNAWMDGTVPTASEHKLLVKAYGPEFAHEAFNPMHLSKYRHIMLETLNIPRSLMASFDVSAPFRQGLIAFARHPLMTSRNLRPMFRYLTSEKGYHKFMEDLQAAPDFEDMQADGLAITDVEHTLANREEQFQSNYAEKITGGRFSPVRASGRAYTGFLVKTRVDMYRYLRAVAEKQGRELDAKGRKQLASYINAATGRGDLGRFERDAVTLNALFFSPRLMASRLNFLDPRAYFGLDPFVRRQKIRAALQTAGAVSAVLWLSSNVAGVKISLNPTSSDFGKVRIGNTRIDVAGGFAQYIRVLSSVAMASVGKGDGKTVDQLVRFFRGKSSPVTSMFTDFATHTNYAGMPLKDWKKELYDSFIPLVVQDVRDVYHQTGSIAAGIGAAVASGTGIGVQSYGAKPKKKAKSAEQKATDWEHKTEKSLGFQLPSDVVMASHTKATYHDAQTELKKELGVTKLSDAQHTALKLQILGAAHPEYAQTAQTFKAELGDAQTRAAIDRWAERALGWPLVDKFSEEARRMHAASTH